MEKTKILESFPMESLTLSKRIYLDEMNQKNFEELNKIDLQTISMSFNTLSNLLSIDKKTYINALRVKFKKPTIFLQNFCKDIWTNPFSIHVGNLWQASTDVQFILDVYVATNYYTSYLTKINKMVTKELKNIIISCNENKIETHTCIQKMGNDFINAH